MLTTRSADQQRLGQIVGDEEHGLAVELVVPNLEEDGRDRAPVSGSAPVAGVLELLDGSLGAGGRTLVWR